MTWPLHTCIVDLHQPLPWNIRSLVAEHVEPALGGETRAVIPLGSSVRKELGLGRHRTLPHEVQRILARDGNGCKMTFNGWIGCNEVSAHGRFRTQEDWRGKL